jgi:hypothetical protein
MTGFIDAFFVQSLLITINTALSLIYTLSSSSLHTRQNSVSPSRLLATDLNTETSTSNNYEVFLSFLLQLPWTTDSLNSTQFHLVYCIPIPLVLDSVLLCPHPCYRLPLYIRGADHTENSSIVAWRGPHRKHSSVARIVVLRSNER